MSLGSLFGIKLTLIYFPHVLFAPRNEAALDVLNNQSSLQLFNISKRTFRFIYKHDYKFTYTCHGKFFKFETKAIGWKVNQHVVPAAAMGRAPLSALWFTTTSLPNLGGADFHSIVPNLPYSSILFPVEDRKSCLQLFPALLAKEFQQGGMHVHTHSMECRPARILFLYATSQPEFRMPLSDAKMTHGIMGWNLTRFCFPLQNTDRARN